VQRVKVAGLDRHRTLRSGAEMYSGLRVRAANVTDATPVPRASESAASTIAAARGRFFCSVRARWKASCVTAGR
jgi:hypothetical protein